METVEATIGEATVVTVEGMEEVMVETETYSTLIMDR